MKEKTPNVIAECIRCGCFFGYYRKPKLDDNGNPLEMPADHVERGASIACPGCGYYPRALLTRGKAGTFFSLAFLAVFPGLMLMFARPLSSQAQLISSDMADLLFNLCLYGAIGILILAVVAALFYHPAAAPFKKWSQQGKLLREGRPRDQWNRPPEDLPKPVEPPVADDAPAHTPPPVDDIAPPADFVPPKTHDDEDQEEDALTAAPATPSPPPRPMPVAASATGAPIAHTATGDMVLLQCPHCHKKFRVPRSVLAGTPKCKACNVPLVVSATQHA